MKQSLHLWIVSIEKDEISAQMSCALSEGWENVLSLPLCYPINPVRKMVPENLPKKRTGENLLRVTDNSGCHNVIMPSLEHGSSARAGSACYQRTTFPVYVI